MRRALFTTNSRRSLETIILVLIELYLTSMTRTTSRHATPRRAKHVLLRAFAKEQKRKETAKKKSV